jgi:hypothetical protein
MGQCEDHVQIAGREKFSLACSDPAVPSSGLTLGAMAIAAAVIGDGGTMSAAHTRIEMTAECGGTTPANGPQHFDVLPTEPVAISFEESSSRGADQIGHLKLFELAEVPKGHAHRFRDTFAVELLLAGVPIERVSVLLGHQSVRITERHYSPWVRARQEQLEQDLKRVWEQDPVALLETKGTPEVHDKNKRIN